MENAIINSRRFGISFRLILLIIALVLLTGIIMGYILYNKPHRLVEKENAISVTAVELFNHYSLNETEANTKYLNKVLLVTGTVLEISSNLDGKKVLILETDDAMFGVSCTLEDTNAKLTVGESISVKGICTGYLADVVITNAVISKGERNE